MPSKAKGLVRRIYPHATFLNGSKFTFKQGEGTVRGSFFNFLASMLFSAFALESYLNYVGKHKLSHWEEMERKLSPKEKLLLLCEISDYEPDFGKKPFQTFIEIFKFRDSVVHAKPEMLRENEIDLSSEDLPSSLPKSKWLEKCTKENAKRYINDSEAIMTQLQEKFGLKRHDIYFPEKTTYWIDRSDSENDE